MPQMQKKKKKKKSLKHKTIVLSMEDSSVKRNECVISIKMSQFTFPRICSFMYISE